MVETKQEPIKLSKNERIEGVFPELHKGPGWSNQILRVLILNYATNSFRFVTFQPNELTPQQWYLFRIGNVVQEDLKATVKYTFVKEVK